MKTINLIIVFSLGILNISAQQKELPNLNGPYFGQKLPGTTPEIFAPGIISTGFMERDFSVSSDGNEIYYGLAIGKLVTIMFTQLKNGRWTEPEIASFARNKNFFHFEPCLSCDGKRIFFLTTRPPKGKEPKPRWAYENIWVADRNPDGSWGEPYDPDTLINGNQQQFYPSLTKVGTLYFCRTDAQTQKNAVYRSHNLNGKYQNPELLDGPMNREGINPYNAFISSDESYLIACTDGIEYKANPGLANYFIFFRDKNDKWSEGIPFGPDINIKGSNAMSASVSPDGKYLFFAAQKTDNKFEDVDKNSTLSKIKEFAASPMNGNYDIYWVDAKVIAELKKLVK